MNYGQKKYYIDKQYKNKTIINWINCPFCKTNKYLENYHHRNNPIVFDCKNHKYYVIIVIDENYRSKIIEIRLFSKYGKIFIYPDKYEDGNDYMIIEGLENKYVDNLIYLDKTITPENVDEKIKTYLTFQ